MKLFMPALLILILVLPLAEKAFAKDIEVQALMGGAAMLVIDGEKILLKEGEISESGVRLLSATADEARVEVDGIEQVLSLSQRITSRFKAPEKNQVRIRMNINRQYIVPGLINGHPVDLLVDTGANVVALNAGMARRLGISTEDGIETIASTASEDTRVIVVTIDEMQVGGIIRKNVHGVVTPGDLPHQVLLGMSFLQGVDITENAGLMVLTSQL